MSHIVVWNSLFIVLGCHYRVKDFISQLVEDKRRTFFTEFYHASM